MDDIDRFKVEHARDPDTDSTPSTEIANRAGRNIRIFKFGKYAVQEYSTESADKLTQERIESIGEDIIEDINMDSIPSRLEVHTDLINDGVVTSDEIAVSEVKSKRMEIIFDKIEDSYISDVVSEHNEPK